MYDWKPDLGAILSDEEGPDPRLGLFFPTRAFRFAAIYFNNTHEDLRVRKEFSLSRPDAKGTLVIEGLLPSLNIRTSFEYVSRWIATKPFKQEVLDTYASDPNSRVLASILDEYENLTVQEGLNFQPVPYKPNYFISTPGTSPIRTEAKKLLIEGISNAHNLPAHEVRQALFPD